MSSSHKSIATWERLESGSKINDSLRVFRLSWVHAWTDKFCKDFFDFFFDLSRVNSHKHLICNTTQSRVFLRRWMHDVERERKKKIQSYEIGARKLEEVEKGNWILRQMIKVFAIWITRESTRMTSLLHKMSLASNYKYNKKWICSAWHS